MKPPRGYPAACACVAALIAAAGCGAPDAREAGPEISPNRIVQLLATGQSVFGVFSGEHTPEQGARIAVEDTDFVFYSLETGPFDIPSLAEYLSSLHAAAGGTGADAHPVVLRIPPIEDLEVAGEQVRQGLDVGLAGIVFPHVASGWQAEASVALLGEDLWPGDPQGALVSIAIVEDRAGIENVREVVGTPGLSVVFAGPGDLRRAYDGDMDAVEAAIQAVLAACKEFGVACGITAGAADIAERLEQGFRVIIVTQPEAVAVGRAAAARL